MAEVQKSLSASVWQDARGTKTAWKAGWFVAYGNYRWWMEYDVLPGQISMEDYLEMIDE